MMVAGLGEGGEGRAWEGAPDGAAKVCVPC